MWRERETDSGPSGFSDGMAVGAAIWWQNRDLWRRRGFAGLAAAAPFVLLLLF
ncbi:hypothetical protein A2U01_0105425 [Trifolium medium]|uniref:Uncharacterized protein n=1 Tax=Trifolium medium TaxID=97028 RepID=A0A392VA71_9FABA|nr:hypothetical protein [Trifolium medium]